MSTIKFSFFCLFCVCLCYYYCSAKDTIATGDSISDGVDLLESAGKDFQMGFFGPRNTSQLKRYVGIWYTVDPDTVVWVANRDSPVTDSAGVLTISADDGSIKVLDKDQKVHFSTPKDGRASMRTLKLLDDGNAILIDVASGSILWQSFDNPTDTFLAGMKMNANLKLTSWKSKDNPAKGNFTFQQEPETRQYVILNGATYWKSGSGSKNNFDQNQKFSQVYLLLSNSSQTTPNLNKYTNGTFSYKNSSSVSKYSRLLMNFTGEIQYFVWDERTIKWGLVLQEPKDACSVYNACGLFGMCSLNNDSIPVCSCLSEFETTSPQDSTAGCMRKSGICGENDEFLNLTMINVNNPTRPFFESNNESYCIEMCLQSCQCQAYSYNPRNEELIRTKRPGGSSGCWIWESELINLQKNGPHNISIRVSKSTNKSFSSTIPREGSAQDKSSSSSLLTVNRVTIFTITTLMILLLCSISYTIYKRVVARRKERDSVRQMDNSERGVEDFLDQDQSREEDTQRIEVPFFEFESILLATENFSDANKLGEGGFGPVYKGKFPGGLEIAVKRLSSLSNQGLEEFKTEVILIAKLQHRNLVRLLGYCIKKNEKMLLYEYLPNKSLDTFIFDKELCTLLDWDKRFEIIMGIARGLLYLHQDSRLRIIHRDLKTSNILLDEEMNANISDFGLAKIINGKEMEASTNRVIGTYGYMAPEYALDGLFSVKSDVYSFGVVMLEIISGKRNTRFYQSELKFSLLGYAWTLWREDKPFELMDKKLMECSNSSEVLKCIIVGLLCVQEDPGDRPTMTNVVLMLGGDLASLPTPKQPAFVARKNTSSSSSSSFAYRPNETETRNTITISVNEGR